MKFKRGTCGANKWLMTFVAEETPICSKESPCETGKGHCDNNESCLSGHCGLKNCPSVDVIKQPRSNLANCCFEGTYCFGFFNYSHAMIISYVLVKVIKLVSKDYFLTILSIYFLYFLTSLSISSLSTS
jgi:hypothetical protein